VQEIPFWDSEGEAVGSEGHFGETDEVRTQLPIRPERALAWIGRESPSLVEPQWYAIHTYSRHEKRIAERLWERGLEVVVPTIREVRRWSDRKKVIETPLFPCYAFIHTVISPEVQTLVLHHPSVLRWVGCQGQPLPIAAEEMANVQTLLHSELPVGPHAFLKAGQRVRIRGGALDGVEGILVSQNGSRKLVVSVELIQQSVEVSLEGYQLEPAG
jgi:transcription antitermination factor NusG